MRKNKQQKIRIGENVPEFHLADLFDIAADAVPERLALVGEGFSYTYADLKDRVANLSGGLKSVGIQRRDHVGLYLMNGPEYIESFLAVSRLGAVPFNVNYRYGAKELQYLFKNADARAVIHNAEYSDIVERLKADLPKLEISVAAEGGCEGSHDYKDLLSAKPVDSEADRSEDDYILQYTGGTTGHPKGVMWPHKAFFMACLGGGGMYVRQPPAETPETVATYASFSFPLRIMPLAPLMHGAAMWTGLSAMLGGQTLVLDPLRNKFDPEAIWDRAVNEQANIIQIVGDAMAVPLLEALKANPDRWDLSRLVHFGSGGAVFSSHIKEELKAFLPNCMMGDGMGTSETGISGMGEKADGEGYMRLPANEAQTVLTNDGYAKVGEVGYLARTGYLPLGYYNDPEKTAEIFREFDGKRWAASGDQARLDGDGMLTVLGRGSTCINSGGEKIYPEEVEEVLRAHPDIMDALVVGVPNPKWGQQVSAVVSLIEGRTEPALEDLQEFCRESLAGYKLPRAIIFKDSVKRSVAGKPDYVWAKEVFS